MILLSRGLFGPSLGARRSSGARRGRRQNDGGSTRRVVDHGLREPVLTRAIGAATLLFADGT